MALNTCEMDALSHRIAFLVVERSRSNDPGNSVGMIELNYSWSPMKAKLDPELQIGAGAVPPRDAQLIALQILRIVAEQRGDNPDDVGYVPPLSWLLYRMNDPVSSDRDRDEAAKAALPYLHAKIPDPAPDVAYELGDLDTIRDVLDAQRRLTKDVAKGLLSLRQGSELMAMLNALIRSLDVTLLADAVEDAKDEFRRAVRERLSGSTIDADDPDPDPDDAA
jgi:hypothetical protein